MKQLSIALLNLNKPHDVAIALQLSKAFNLHVYSIGTTLDPDHYKIQSKVASWTVDMSAAGKGNWERVASLKALHERGFTLVSTSPRGGTSLFSYRVGEKDIFVLGGASGLSKENIAQCDTAITIPCDPAVPFLTVGSVIPLLIGHAFSV